jgi:hypothetical protein
LWRDERNDRNPRCKTEVELKVKGERGRGEAGEDRLGTGNGMKGANFFARTREERTAIAAGARRGVRSSRDFGDGGEAESLHAEAVTFAFAGRFAAVTRRRGGFEWWGACSHYGN